MLIYTELLYAYYTHFSHLNELLLKRQYLLVFLFFLILLGPLNLSLLNDEEGYIQCQLLKCPRDSDNNANK